MVTLQWARHIRSQVLAIEHIFRNPHSLHRGQSIQSSASNSTQTQCFLSCLCRRHLLHSLFSYPFFVIGWGCFRWPVLLFNCLVYFFTKSIFKRLTQVFISALFFFFCHLRSSSAFFFTSACDCHCLLKTYERQSLHLQLFRYLQAEGHVLQLGRRENPFRYKRFCPMNTPRAK
jgi:hypothetical protein